MAKPIKISQRSLLRGFVVAVSIGLDSPHEIAVHGYSYVGRQREGRPAGIRRTTVTPYPLH
jgi:hypothetical protein